jgi:hypothetical protein
VHDASQRNYEKLEGLRREFKGVGLFVAAPSAQPLVVSEIRMNARFVVWVSAYATQGMAVYMTALKPCDGTT